MNFRVSYHSNICTIKSPSSVGRSPRDWESWRSWVRRRHSPLGGCLEISWLIIINKSRRLWQGHNDYDKVKKSVTWSRRLWQGQEDCDEITKTLTRSHRLWQGHRCKKFLVICKSCNDDLCVDVLMNYTDGQLEALTFPSRVENHLVRKFTPALLVPRLWEDQSSEVVSSAQPHLYVDHVGCVG